LSCYPQIYDSFTQDGQIYLCARFVLKKVELKNKNEISEAHIIPKAAGGNIKTFLCRKCNSILGSKQDKWFGELIRLIEAKENIIQTKFKEKAFFLCDKKVRGRFEYKSENGMKVMINKDRNPPEINDFVMNKFLKEKNKTFSFSIPILKEQRLINVG